MTDARHIAVKPLPGISPEQVRDARARAWAFVFDCHMKESAAGMTSTNGTSVRNTEEVSNVERSNRPLAVEATHRPQKGKHGRND